MNENKRLKIKCLHCTLECTPISTKVSTKKEHLIFYDINELLEWFKNYLEKYGKDKDIYIIDENRIVHSKEAVHKQVREFLTYPPQA